MVKRRLRMISAVLAGAALMLWTLAAATAEENDLREFRLGMRADELPPDAREYGDIELALAALNRGEKIKSPGIRH